MYVTGDPVPEIANNVFDGNLAYVGAGIAYGSYASPGSKIHGNTFQNQNDPNRNGFSGGMEVEGSPEIYENLFVVNLVRYRGAAVGVGGGLPVFHHNTFVSNETRGNGGAMSVYNGRATLHHNLFYENIGWDTGGAIWLFVNGEIDATNNVFWANHADGGTGAGGAIYFYESQTPSSLTNNTFWKNSSTGGGTIDARSSSPVLRNNIISAGNQTVVREFDTGVRPATPRMFWNSLHACAGGAYYDHERRAS